MRATVWNTVSGPEFDFTLSIANKLANYCLVDTAGSQEILGQKHRILLLIAQQVAWASCLFASVPYAS